MDVRKSIRNLRSAISLARTHLRMTVVSDAFRREIIQRLTRDLLDIQLLRLLRAEPMWGYKIIKAFERELGIKLRHGALYPTLNCLEKGGFLVSEKKPQNGRARKIYSLTPKGREYLSTYFAVLREQMKVKGR